MWTRIRHAAVMLIVLSIRPAMAPAQLVSGDPAMPALPATGPTIESLVPDGWTIEQRHQADFDRDGHPDALLLLRQASAQGTMPRILLLTLATPRPRGYALSAANARLVPRDSSGNLEDPMADGEITVRPGGFDLKLGMISGTGSYVAATMRFRFRFERGCFRLIGYDRAETHRGTLDTRDLSVDFLTAAVIRTTGNAQSGVRETRRTRLIGKPRLCLPDLPSGWTFDPLAATPNR